MLNFIQKLVKHLNKDTKVEDIYCPVCGYYCLGHGGIGCIDKPTVVKLDKK